ncbi:nucleoside-diphosphate kinase [Candidatus Micrarchaeota archaeon CG1_02_55_22]|nr:MAG: nucleoside-diphosphate kinase [Candidatus Micrarchaeota archaeon CG1_02_55_22]
MERTLVLIKPDALQRGLVGEMVTRLERKGLKIAAAKMFSFEDKVLEEHYAHLKDKPFFPRIREFMKSTPLLAMVLEGKDAVEVVRRLAGPTNGREAPAGTIRGDYAVSIQCNLVHASDSKEAAEKEVARFFKPAEIFNWEAVLMDNYYANEEKG